MKTKNIILHTFCKHKKYYTLDCLHRQIESYCTLFTKIKIHILHTFCEHKKHNTTNFLQTQKNTYDRFLHFDYAIVMLQFWFDSCIFCIAKNHKIIANTEQCESMTKVQAKG